MVTNNPDPRINGVIPDGTTILIADGGADFWLAGGPAGCYEAIDGSWINVATGLPVKVANPSSAAFVKPASTLRGTAAVYDLRGARVGRSNRDVPTRLHHGLYVVAGRVTMIDSGIRRSGLK